MFEQRSKKRFKQGLKEQSGASAMIYALCLVPMTLVGGMALNFS